MLITQKQAIEYIDLGLIESASIMAEPFDEPGWSIEFFGNGDRSFTLKSSRGEGRRVFKTVDTAINSLRDIGIKATGLTVSV